MGAAPLRIREGSTSTKLQGNKVVAVCTICYEQAFSSLRRSVHHHSHASKQLASAAITPPEAELATPSDRWHNL